jgi:hypothetical protein
MDGIPEEKVQIKDNSVAQDLTDDYAKEQTNSDF